MYQNAPFGYLSIRTGGVVVNSNTTLLKWLDYDRAEIIHQKSIQDLLTIGGKIYLETHVFPLLQMQGEITEINLELVDKHGKKLPVLINGRRVMGQSASEPIYRFSLLNISQRKQYELELMKARKEAEETVKRLKQVNQALEQFAYIASHDLQAPLNTISGLINLIGTKGHIQQGSELDSYFSLIKRNSSRMKLMINDLLEYAKIDGKDVEFTKCSLNEVCEISLELINDQVVDNEATFAIPELPMVNGDKLQLVRLFQNLFGNAIKYRSESNPCIQVDFEDRQNDIKVFVRDNGTGFDPEYAEQVFGFMKRLHSHDSIPGTGIGLSTCKRIVEIHKGTIGVTSAPGKGSTFFFTLPKSPTQADL
nr:ATP-binding protein [Lunatimonas sp.]